MKIYSLFLLLAFTLIVSCTESKRSKVGNDENSQIQILKLPESGYDTLKASYFADTVVYVPLETTGKNYFRRLKQIWMNDSVILINTYSSLLMFKKDGKFVRKIGRQGKGPGEYTHIFNFTVLEDTIYLSSTGRRSFLKYTMKGKFCDEIPLNYQPVFFSSTKEGDLACYNRAEGEIYIYSKGCQVPDTIAIEHDVAKERYLYVISDPSFMTYFQKTTTDLLFNTYTNDTIWNITGKGKKVALLLNKTEKFLPKNKQIEFCNGEFQRWEKMVKAYHLVQLVPFSSCMLIFQKRWMDTKCDAIYLRDFKTNSTKRYYTSTIYDDIVGNQPMSYYSFTNSPDYLISSEYPYKILENIKNSNKKKKTSARLINQMKTADANDNPILILFKIRKKF